MELWEELTVGMLPPGTYRKIAQEIGPQNFYRLAKLVGGTTIYIPKPDSVLRPVRDARIRKEYNGYNCMELAKKYNVTERWVQQLCGEYPIPGQYNIFDYLEEEEYEDKRKRFEPDQRL